MTPVTKNLHLRNRHKFKFVNLTFCMATGPAHNQEVFFFFNFQFNIVMSLTTILNVAQVSKDCFFFYPFFRYILIETGPSLCLAVMMAYGESRTFIFSPKL